MMMRYSLINMMATLRVRHRRRSAADHEGASNEEQRLRVSAGARELMTESIEELNPRSPSGGKQVYEDMHCQAGKTFLESGWIFWVDRGGKMELGLAMLSCGC